MTDATWAASIAEEPVASAPARRPWIDFRKPVSTRASVGLAVAAWTAFLLAWQLAATSGLAPEKLFPPPTTVLEAGWELFAERGFAADVWASIVRIVISFALAVAVALPLGMLMGSFPAVEAVANPLVSAFRYLPAPSFLPLLLMWLGTGDEQKVALLFLGVVWFLVTLVMDDTKSVPMELIETAKTLGIDRFQTLRTVIFPAALPRYLDTMRQMLAVSWTYLVIAEIVASTDGIGAMMMRAKRFVRIEDIMVGIVVIGVLGFAFDVSFRALRWLCFPYLRRARP